jgi:6-phosphogluconolactonase/glucosamine-6-phosphate isomerase/deaminase
MTMTYPLLNAARAMAVLVAGAAKRHALRRVGEHLAQQPGPTPQLPITAIRPAHADADMTWYLDRDAATT